MKRSYKNILHLIISFNILAGCDDYLNENPDNRVELNSTEKAAQLLTNSYSTANYNFTEWMSDNVQYTFGTRKLPEHDQAYTWGEFTGIEQDTPSNFWNSTYDAIAHANEVLAVIDELPGEDEKKDAIEGEALLIRAYGHFMLVNMFAKHYNKQTADDDPGIPYIEEPETVFIKKYTRHSVDDVYDKIEDDLLDGLKLVDGSFYSNSGKYHFTRSSALAFASRFYLFKGDYANCVKYSNQLLGDNPTVFIKDIPRLQAEQINPEDYIRQYHAPGDDSNLLLMRIVSNYHAPSLGHWPSRPFYSELFANNPFGLTDERENPAWIAGENGLAAAKFEFLFERTSLTSNVGYNYTIFLAFRGEEVLLNRAECYIFQNELDKAIADFQLLAEKRYDGEPVVNVQDLQFLYRQNSDQGNLFFYLLDERRKEFLHEGMRWFDIKRFKAEIQHIMPDGSSLTLEADDDRKVLQIPQAAIDVGGLEPNPR
jgi:hypothetical protein